MKQVTIGPNEAGQRLDKFLHKYLPNAGTNFLYKMLRKKNITLNGKKADGKEILSANDIVCCFFSDETFYKFAHNESAPPAIVPYQKAYDGLKGIGIVYEDENIIILNKPAGVLSQKAKDSDMSLNEWLIGYLLKTQAVSPVQLQTFKPSVCNRLDRNTSGIVLCGKSLKGSQILSSLIKEHRLQKFYYTICEGVFQKEALIEGYLVKNHRTNRVEIYTENTDGPSEYIKTRFVPLAVGRTSPQSSQKGLEGTFLCVELFTGKTHQIRAHLSSVGHPVIGDVKYGGIGFPDLKHQLLHAHHVIFPKDEALGALSQATITAPCPVSFHKYVHMLGLEDKIQINCL